MANFPTTVASFTDPSSTNFLNNPAHATQHSNENDEIVAIETKVGTGASTPASNTYLHGTGTGTSSWDALVINRAFGFFTTGGAVANDLSWNPIAPQALTAIKIWAHCQIVPTGADLIVQVYNITQAHVVASLTITASGSDANATSMTNASIAAGDVLRLDITQVGSTIAGGNISVLLECTQP